LQNMQTKVNELMATKPIMSEFDAIFRHYTVRYVYLIINCITYVRVTC